MIITYEDLASIREKHRNQRIVMLKGTFDLFHVGHVRMVERAKALGDILVVLVKCDEAVKLKGNDRPFECEQDRAEIIDSVRYVDYTLIADRKIDTGIDVPEKDRNQYLRYYYLVSELRPDVLIKPDKKLPDILLNLYHEIGTEIHEVEETKGVSTTILVNKIRGV
ncbi:MAG: adenylyltransferase/cytidyltransferase family protein [Lachnospiraceae bacterium]|nr:adenylyltransferase/cytidyltransferase family protein [Lachnospiraceae bacterium]